MADSQTHGPLHRAIIWLAFVFCVLIDVVIGVPVLLLGTDFHFGPLGFITTQSLWSPIGLVIVSGLVVLHVILVMRLIHQTRRG